MTPEQARRLGLKLLHAAGAQTTFPEHTVRLLKRLERLFRVLLAGQGEPGFRWLSQRRWNDARLEDAPRALASNPLAWPGFLARREARRVPPSSRRFAHALAARLRTFGPPLPAEHREGLAGPKDCARRLARALGAEPHGQFPSLLSDCHATLRLLGKTLWTRLQVFPRRARFEAAALERRLADAAQRPHTPEATRELAEQILLLLAEDQRAFEEALRLEAKFVALFDQFLAERYGEGPQARLLGPPGQLLRELQAISDAT